GIETLVGAFTKLIARNTTVSFENAAGRRRNRPFVATAEHERVALVHDEETPNTQWELQRVPSKLERVANEIAGLARVLDRGATAALPRNESKLTRSGEGARVRHESGFC